MIKRLRLRNFRSFDEVDIELGSLNIIVGANASGKTNLVQAFRFLRDLARHGLENAVSLQGGTEYLTNLNTRERELEIEVTYHAPLTAALPAETGHRELHFEVCDYQLHLHTTKKTSSAKIRRESLTIRYYESGDPAQLNSIHFVRKGNQVRIETEGTSKLLDTWLPSRRRFRIHSSTASQLSLPMMAHIPPFLPLPFAGHIEIYNFAPHLAKQAVPIESAHALREDGQNLPLIVQRIVQTPEGRNRLLKLAQFVLPHLKQIGVSAPLGRHVSLQVQETFFEGRSLPAFLLSDGTIEVIAVIVALAFSHPLIKSIILEEPDRNLHPAAVGKLLELFRDVSQEKQILLTTHNPELIRLARLEEILLVERRPDGCSIIKRPAESETVRLFLEEDLGLDYLHANAMLGA